MTYPGLLGIEESRQRAKVAGGKKAVAARQAPWEAISWLGWRITLCKGTDKPEISEASYGSYETPYASRI